MLDRCTAGHLTARGCTIPVRAVPLATSFRPDGSPPPFPLVDRPYFLLLGTIEPRKNHLLILHLWWRRLVAERGPQRTPALVLVGRRG